MNVELMLQIAARAKKNQERNSDVSISFQDVDSRLALDRAAERLIMVLMIRRWCEGKTFALRLN